MSTRIGQFLREIRLEHGEILKTMAERLGVSSAFLSAVENGKKKMPESWNHRLTELYGLTKEQQEQMRLAVLESADTVELNIREATNTNRNLAVCFARRFDDLDEMTSRRILDILLSDEDE